MRTFLILLLALAQTSCGLPWRRLSPTLSRIDRELPSEWSKIHRATR